jgi:STE24 endopeptidase
MSAADVPAPSGDARRYADARYWLLLAELAVGLAVLVTLQGSGASAALARFWSGRASGEPLILLGYLTVFGFLYAAALLPLEFYGGFVLEHRFGLSRLSLRAWWVRQLKQWLISGLLAALLLEGFYGILRHAPRAWPLWAALGWVFVSVLLTRVFPTLLLPVFYRTSPLADEALSRRLLALCARAGIAALGVFRVGLGAETRKANAALAGLGGSRRILLSDTLLSDFPPEQIEGVLAHELGHQRYRHLLILLGLSGVGALAAFWLTALVAPLWCRPLGLHGLSDVAGFPALSLWLSALGLIALPLQNGLSRRLEWQADRFAVALSGGRAFAAALQRLASLNLADPSPPRWIVWWFYDHPPITQRIRAAEAASV